MKITHYLYNAFIIESEEKKIAIDPGGLFFYRFRFSSLIPKVEWSDITHILVTHADPDHYWHADRVAEASRAPLICNKSMVREIKGLLKVLGPRDRGLAFTTTFPNLKTLAVGETIDCDGLKVTGVKTTHGELIIKLGPFRKAIKPGPEERIGWGSIGFSIEVDGVKLVNLGDTLLHVDEWASIESPDVLMLPIGGKSIHNTMDELEALEAVKVMRPKLVIPCHYNCPAFFTKTYNPADAQMFKREVEKLGIECSILHAAESLDFSLKSSESALSGVC